MTFFTWLEHTRVAVWVDAGDTVFAYPTVLLFHTIGLTLLVGINIIIDLKILGFAPEMPLAPIRKFFRLMWTGLAINAVTGVLLFSAKATKDAVNPAFYIKMVAIALALTVFLGIKASVFGDPQLDTRPFTTNGKVLAALSLALWLTAITAGRVIAYVREASEFGLLVLR